jgi:hypothetical protein
MAEFAFLTERPYSITTMTGVSRTCCINADGV